MLKKSLIERLEHRIAPAGLVIADYNATTGELTLTGDDLDNTFEVFRTSATTFRVEGRPDAALVETSINEIGNERLDIDRLTKLTIVSGGGSDEIDLVNLKLKSLTADTGAGNDDLRTANLSVAGAVVLTLGAGNDVVDLDGVATVIAGNVTLNDSADGGTLNLGAASTKILGSLAFNGGTGTDRLSGSAASIISIAKGIGFNGGGAGNDQIRFGEQGTTTIGRSATGQSIAFTGGSGADSISIGGYAVTMRGSVEMLGSGGNDELDLDGVKVTVGRNAAGVSVLMDGGAGSDEIDLTGTTLTLAGILRHIGGTEADTLDLSNIRRFAVGGAIDFDGGSGADTFTIEAEVLALAAGVKFAGGDDADTADIEGDGFIKGPVDLQLGSATSGIQSANIRGLSGIAGSLALRSTLAVDSTAAISDTLKLTNMVAAKAITLRFGDGASEVDIDNLTAASTLVIETRGGSDDVQIERDATFRSSLIRGATTISLGDGSDILAIGKDSKNNRVLFAGSITADGGAASDNRNDIAAMNRFTPPAKLIENGFEAASIP